MPQKASFVHKLLTRIDRVDRESVQNYITALAEEAQRTYEILDEMEEGAILIDLSGVVRLINRTASLWLDINPGTVLNKTGLLSCVKDHDLHGLIKKALSGLTDEICSDVHMLVPKDLHLRVRIKRLQTAKEEFLLIHMMNKTDRKTVELQGEKERRFETLIRLAAGVAHEIGNPLNSISIHLGLLKKEIEDLPDAKRKKLEKTLQVLNAETSRLDRIVRNFLKATRKPPLRFRDENLNDILKDAVNFMGPELNQAGVSVKFNADPKMPRFLLDRERIYECVINLIKNAMEAMPSGGALQITLTHKDKVAVLRFKDGGRGIEDKDLEHIFEAYYTTKAEGSGLGLMTVYNAVAEHDGRIEVSSDVGKGTVFTLLLPIRGPKLQIENDKQAE